MRSIVAAAVLSLVTGFTLSAQQAEANDTTLPSGTQVRFWSPTKHTWLEGSAMRFFPNSGGVCLGLLSEALGGFESIQRVDSLQVLRTVPPTSSTPAPAKQWRTIPVAPLRAREPMACRLA